MRAPALAPALAPPLAPALALLLGGCSGVNPLGFWDMTKLEVTWNGETQVVEDLGSWEMSEHGGGIVLRYRTLDPTVVDAGGTADTGGYTAEEGSWFVPRVPPLVGGAPQEGYERNTVSFGLGLIRFVDAPVEKYRGSTMQIWEEGTNMGQANPVDARLYLER